MLTRHTSFGLSLPGGVLTIPKKSARPIQHLWGVSGNPAWESVVGGDGETGEQGRVPFPLTLYTFIYLQDILLLLCDALFIQRLAGSLLLALHMTGPAEFIFLEFRDVMKSPVRRHFIDFSSVAPTEYGPWVCVLSSFLRVME